MTSVCPTEMFMNVYLVPKKAKIDSFINTVHRHIQGTYLQSIIKYLITSHLIPSSKVNSMTYCSIFSHALSTALTLAQICIKQQRRKIKEFPNQEVFGNSSKPHNTYRVILGLMGRGLILQKQTDFYVIFHHLH